MAKLLFTSNYTLYGHDRRAFAISVRPPPWYCGSYLRELAPTWDIVIAYRAGEITKHQYTRAYLQILESRNIDVSALVDALDPSSILLCYEKTNEFCHRHIAAQWLMDNADVTVVELIDGQTPEQMTITNDLLTF
jgi:uncharacterized protein YeaO (DUF488 family)